jgi:hypothetical protein
MIRDRGKVGREKYQTSMDRKDLHPDEWIEHYQQELADALQYAERIKGATRLLHEAHSIMLRQSHEMNDESYQWIVRYEEQFCFQPASPVPVKQELKETHLPSGNWTKEKPTKDGFYWYRDEGEEPEVIEWDSYLGWVITCGNGNLREEEGEIKGEFWSHEITPPN